MAAMGVGLAQGAFDQALAYAKERRAFGRPISKFQSIQAKLADLSTEIEATRLLVQKAAWLKDLGRNFTLTAAQAKLKSGRIAVRTADEAVQIHGGYGYIEEYPVCRFYRDAKILTIGEGTDEIQRAGDRPRAGRLSLWRVRAVGGSVRSEGPCGWRVREVALRCRAARSRCHPRGGRVVAILAPAAVASARSRLAGTARLEGRFQMTGRITVARHVLGEHAGEVVTRAWTFTPLCPAGPCKTVALTRRREAGIDTVTLHFVSAERYAGRGRFYAPLRCGTRMIPRGEAVPFKIGDEVRITHAVLKGGVRVASELSASYVNRKRTNLTPASPARPRRGRPGAFAAARLHLTISARSPAGS